jgi:hypothetical protein
VLGALGKAQDALDQDFAKCNTQHKPLAKKPAGKPALPSAIYRALGKAFAVCYEALGKKKET